MKTLQAILVTLLLCTPLAAVEILSFRQGVNGYTSAKDIWIATGTDIVDATGEAFSSDINDSDPNFYTLAILKFEDLGIPVGSTIHNATLNISINNHGSGIFLHRILQPWDETSTWNSLGNGPDLHSVPDDGWGVQSHIPGPCTIFIPGCPWPYGQAWPFEAGFNYDMDVTLSLVEWVENGGDNQGWALSPPHPNGTNAVGVWTSDASVVTDRPMLTVTYTPIPEPRTFFGITLAILSVLLVRRNCHADKKDREEEAC